ncbi:CDP-alcohol phosphatidyltransferase family protein [Streptomyces sp. NPDC006984]|uniref:CDP-alcohol phosphatidyltransferase family protein n=1 Tax=Streptomyces sp. NPDC006984 TaxID=3155463 RepID=UPI0033CB18B6
MAVGLDLADGRLARHQGTSSPFGDYADTFADAAFWTWLTLRHEPSAAVRGGGHRGLGAARRHRRRPRPAPRCHARAAPTRPAASGRRSSGRRRPPAPDPPLTSAAVTACRLPTSPACPRPVRPARTPHGP